MPTSLSVHTSDVCRLFEETSPSSVLDVGVGFGRWGFCVREVCEVRRRRYEPAAWKVKLDGLEPWTPYITPMHRWLYSSILPMTAQDWLTSHPSAVYDVIIAGDVLEHLPKGEAQTTADFLRARASRMFIGAVPLGTGWKQGTVLGNRLEAHQSVWTEADVRIRASRYKIYTRDRGLQYAVWFTACTREHLRLSRAWDAWSPGDVPLRVGL